MNDNVEPIRDSTLAEVQTDAMIAKEIREAIIPPLLQVTTIIDQAKAKGLVITIQIGTDMYGRSVPNVGIVRPL